MATYEIGFVSNNWFKEVHGKPAYVEDGFCEHQLENINSLKHFFLSRDHPFKTSAFF